MGYATLYHLHISITHVIGMGMAMKKIIRMLGCCLFIVSSFVLTSLQLEPTCCYCYIYKNINCYSIHNILPLLMASSLNRFHGYNMLCVCLVERRRDVGRFDICLKLDQSQRKTLGDTPAYSHFQTTLFGAPISSSAWPNDLTNTGQGETKFNQV